jgi:perosamine synthetase
METLARAKNERNMVTIVEDLAEAHGVTPHPSTDAACWSFYRNKIVAGEEGGMVAFREPEYADLARQLRNHGFTDAHDFTHIPRGCNYRMADTLASLVLASLDRYEPNLNRRLDLLEAYDAACPLEWRMPPRDAPWVYDFRVPGMSYGGQGTVVGMLNEVKVEARYAFKPLSSQKEFRGSRRFGGENAEGASREVVYLPLTPGTCGRGEEGAFAEKCFEAVKRVSR